MVDSLVGRSDRSNLTMNGIVKNKPLSKMDNMIGSRTVLCHFSLIIWEPYNEPPLMNCGIVPWHADLKWISFGRG